MDHQALATFKKRVRRCVNAFYISKGYADFNGNFQTEETVDVLHLNSESNWGGTYDVDISFDNNHNIANGAFLASAKTHSPSIVELKIIRNENNLIDFLWECTQPKDSNPRYIVYSKSEKREEQISLPEFTKIVNESYEMLDEIKNVTKTFLTEKQANFTDLTPDDKNRNEENFTGSDWQHIIWTITFDPKGIPKEINTIQISIDINYNRHKQSRSVTVRAFKDSHRECNYDCDGHTYQNALRIILGQPLVFTNSHCIIWNKLCELIDIAEKLQSAVS